MKRLLLILLFLLIVPVGVLHAIDVPNVAEYKSKEFPPGEIIRKNLEPYVAKDNYDIGSLIGKYKISDNVYVAYILLNWKHGSRSQAEEITLIHLDSDIWILKWNDHSRVVTK